VSIHLLRWPPLPHAICSSVNQNHDYLFPPAPPSPVVAGLQTGAVQTPQPTAAPPPTPPTAAALNVAAGLQPGPHLQPAPPIPQPASNSSQSTSQPAATPVDCHSERSEESAVSIAPATPPTQAQQSASAPPQSEPEPESEFLDHSFMNQALPLPVRRRMHRSD
jgi:hypothetical protein